VVEERERSESGELHAGAVVYLANRECPWRCLMCDLWTDTLEETTAPGSIPRQVRAALAQTGPVRQVKLYNAGSFFDPRAIPPEDHAAIAQALSGIERVIVECHPALVSRKCRSFADALDGALEVALGLETANEVVLARLNKGMTVADYARAAEKLAAGGIALRTFLLVGLPFSGRDESLSWCRRSIAAAFDAGSTAVSLILTRAGNGAMDALARAGEFTRPDLAMLEEASGFGVSLARGRVFADLWGLELAAECAVCLPARIERLRVQNDSQSVGPPVSCERHG
jgi:radical SAM enzyme (TIGR01210 family)